MLTKTPGSLRLDAIGKRFGAVDALSGIDVDINAGEFVVIVGPSGCGKSTLLRTIAGLETSTSGRIVLGGRDVTAVPAAKRGLAMVFQSYALYPHKTVAENMGFALKIARVPRTEIDARVAEAARVLQLESLLDRKPAALSGGQRQRVAIGRAIVREPEVFLFDEPLSNLDAALRADMRVELGQLHQKLGSTMVYVTHDQVEAMTLADKIVVLKEGEVQQIGSPKELYSTPANRFVAGFIGSPRMNLIEGDIRGGRFEAPGVAVDLVRAVLDGAVTLGIRPEHARVAPESETAGVALTVNVVEYLGDESVIHGTLQHGQPFMLRVPGEANVHEGQVIALSLDMSEVHLFDTAGQRVVA